MCAIVSLRRLGRSGCGARSVVGCSFRSSHVYSREAELRCGEMGEDDGVRLRMVDEGNELIFDLYSPGDHMTSRVVPPTSGDQAR